MVPGASPLDHKHGTVSVTLKGIETMTKVLQVRIEEDLRIGADGARRTAPRVAEVVVDFATQAKMDEISALWSKRKAQKT